MAQPAGVPARRWLQLLEDARRFMAAWAASAAALGWGTLDVFGAHPRRPIERGDCAGLVWLLNGAAIAGLTAERCIVRTRSGAAQTIYRTTGAPAGEAAALWQLTC